MTREIKILFVCPHFSSFIQKDLELLRNHFDVRAVEFVFSRDFKGTLKTVFGMIIGTLWSDVTFSWFAYRHAFWAVFISKILRKKSIVVVGGGEVAKIPEIGYGMLSNPRSTRIVKFVLKYADMVLTVDDGLRRDALKNAGVSGNNIQTVPTGYDNETFKPKGEKENLVISVSAIDKWGKDNWGRIRLKGLDTFVKSAKLLPNVNFLVIGKRGDVKKLQDIAPPNIEFIGHLSQDELIPFYQRAKVYCQLSMREGLPNALCEAMLCECVPVGTDVPGVRTAIGDTGFYVAYGGVEATAEAIKKALNSDKGKEARARIKKMFTVERREKELIRIIKKM